MPPIKCKEPNCAEYISGPGTAVNVLFGVSQLMHTLQSAPLTPGTKKEAGALLQELEQKIGLDPTVQSVQRSSSLPPDGEARVLVLECILKHRHTYVVPL